MTGNFVKSAQLKASFVGLSRLPFGKQFGLVLGLVAGIALIILLGYWASGEAVQAQENGSAAGQRGGVVTAPVETSGKTTGVVSATGKDRLWDIGQLVFAGLLAVLLLLGVIRPLMRDLAKLAAPGKADVTESEPENAKTQTAQSAQADEYARYIENIRSLARDDPERVARLLKIWINETSPYRN